MNWFDEQLRFRKEKDDESFADAIDSIAGAIMGKHLTRAADKREVARSAIEEILKYYHYKIKSGEMPPQLKTLDEQVEYRIRPFGIMRREVVLDKGWHRRAVGPMLGSLRADGTPVALIPGRLSGYTYTDPASGRRVRINRRTQRLLDEQAICFYKPLPLRSLTMLDLLKFMVQQLRPIDIAVYVGMMALSAALGLLTPMFTKWLFGSVLQSGSARVLLALAGFMVSFSLCQVCLSAFQALANSVVNIRQNIAVQAAVMGRIMSLPTSFFKDYSAGELTQRSSYVLSLCTTMMSTIGTTGISSLFSLIYVGQIFAYAPALVLPSLIITLLTAGLSIFVTLFGIKFKKEEMLCSSKISGMTYSMITGIKKIKLAGAEKRMFSRWARNYSNEAAYQYDPPLFVKLSGTINLAISLIGTVVLYLLAIRSAVSVADYYAFNSAYGMISSAFMSMASIAVSVSNIKPILEMAKPIMEAVPEVPEGRESVNSLRGGIELSHVSFRYDEDMPYVIDDLSLTVRPGEYLAVVGATGCGKSTLLRLLLGFEKPQKGSIFYDRKDLSRIDVKSLRRRIGVVMQDGKLFLGDIYSNISIAAPQLTLAEAWEAAEIASIADDIRAMPMGMHTMICEGQGGISGGQQQRLMIARAVAPKPRILMFDEATSALDNVTQRKVSEAIDGLNCTRIIIAHRLSTIKRCDRIIVLDKGKIAEDGTYDELIERDGLFAELVRRQRLDIEDIE